jgi:hypothetical protein
MKRMKGHRQSPDGENKPAVAAPRPDAEQPVSFRPTIDIPANGAAECSDEAGWAAKNKRRGMLIHKQFSEGLMPSEEEELRQLQAEMADYLDQVAPISFEVLEELEAVARRVARAADPNESAETTSG